MNSHKKFRIPNKNNKNDTKKNYLFKYEKVIGKPRTIKRPILAYIFTNIFHAV